MGTKQSKEAHGAAGKKDCLLFDPKELVIVDDAGSALHDERASLPVSEALVLNIMHHGVLEPVLVRKNAETGKTEVVAGRQRVKACVEANKRLKSRGLEPHRVSAIVKRGEAHALMGMMISENAIREDETPIGRAKKMARYIDLGRTEEETAVMFGCSVATVKNSLGLLDAPKAVQKAVASGKVTASDGYKLAKMEPEAAAAKVKELEAVAPREPGKKRRSNGAAARKVVDGGSGVRGKREIAAKIEEMEAREDIKEMWRVGILAALMWAMGDETAMDALVAK